MQNKQTTVNGDISLVEKLDMNDLISGFTDRPIEHLYMDVMDWSPSLDEIKDSIPQLVTILEQGENLASCLAAVMCLEQLEDRLDMLMEDEEITQAKKDEVMELLNPLQVDWKFTVSRKGEPV